MIVPTLIKQIMLPPASLITLAIVAFVSDGRVRGLGRRVAFAALLAAYAFSTPILSNSLLRLVQEKNVDAPSAQAVVILSAGLIAQAPEYGGATVDALTLERLRMGAATARRTRLPVLVTGGVLDTTVPPVAVLMSRVLADDYGIKARWIESASRTTAENASLSAPLLKAAGIKSIYLVTHSWHMTRARFAFERQGFVVAAAGTGYRQAIDPEPADFLPSAKALLDSYYAMHELVGLAYYHLML